MGRLRRRGDVSNLELSEVLDIETEDNTRAAYILLHNQWNIWKTNNLDYVYLHSDVDYHAGPTPRRPSSYPLSILQLPTRGPLLGDRYP